MPLLLAGLADACWPGCGVVSTIGFTADVLTTGAAGATGVGAGAGAAVAGTTACEVRVVVCLVTVRTGTGAAAFAIVVRLCTVLVVERVGAEVSGVVSVVSVVAGVLSTTGAGSALTGAGSVTVGVGCAGTSWASALVDESARAAAIAGRALVRA
jgi:hypothetical protein